MARGRLRLFAAESADLINAVAAADWLTSAIHLRPMLTSLLLASISCVLSPFAVATQFQCSRVAKKRTSGWRSMAISRLTRVGAM